jgi:hypothetical protein
MALGFLPRYFNSSDPQDKVIYEEDQEVSEFYFVVEGNIGFAINGFNTKMNATFYKVARK